MKRMLINAGADPRQSQFNALRFKLGIAAVIASLSLGASPVTAAMISDNNVFRNQSTARSTAFNGTFESIHAVDSVSTDANSPFGHFIFNDADSTRALQIFGFNSSIGTIRFFGPDLSPYTERTSNGVHIYYSTTINSANLTPASYIDLGQFALSVVNQQYQLVSTGPQVSGENEPNYAQLTGLGIPAGTQSVLFVFNVSTVNARTGVAFTEIQGFVPEPTSFVMLLTGLIALLARRRRT